MTTYLKSPVGDITIAPDFKGAELERVPAGYWRVEVDPFGKYYLSPVKPFEVPEKIYGSLLKHVPRIKQVFDEKVHGMTVMLEGLKGSGKSLLMKYISKDFVDNHEGIVIINEGYSGPDFFTFIQNIQQQKIVITDEFDKKYKDTEKRNSLLSLLDGTYPSHTMYILTMNASSRHESFEFFHNRPGRVFFNLKFNAVDIEAIEAYFKDTLDDQSKLLDVMAFIKRFRAFNMDMLGTLSAEINACPELSLDDIAEYLNIKPDVQLSDMYLTAEVTINGYNAVDALTSQYLSNENLQHFLKSLQQGRECVLNICTSSRTYLDDQNKITYIASDSVNRTNVLKNGKQSAYIGYFDVYLNTKEAAITRNEEGNFIITQTVELPKIHDSISEYVADQADDEDTDQEYEIQVEIKTSTVTRYDFSM